MAEKKEEKVDATMIPMSALKEMLQAMGEENAKLAGKIAADAIQKYKEESEKPTQKELAKKAKLLRDSAIQEEANTKQASQRRNQCKHRNPRGRTRYNRAYIPQNVLPGAAMLVCSRCFDTVKNFEIKITNSMDKQGFDIVKQELKLVHNPRFNELWEMASSPYILSFN